MQIPVETIGMSNISLPLADKKLDEYTEWFLSDRIYPCSSEGSHISYFLKALVFLDRGSQSLILFHYACTLLSIYFKLMLICIATKGVRRTTHFSILVKKLDWITNQ